MAFWFTQFADNISHDFIDLLSRPEEIVNQGDVIKDDKSTTVVRFQWQGKFYILKRFNARNKGHAVKRSLRKTRARNCWQISQVFSSYGISVAKPVAMLEKRVSFLKSDSYFISEQIEGHELLQWLPNQTPQTKNMVEQQVRKMFAVFEKNRLSHGDMKATNLLWSDQKIVLIDLDVAKQHTNGVLFTRAHARDKRRFSRNGAFFSNALSASS